MTLSFKTLRRPHTAEKVTIEIPVGDAGVEEIRSKQIKSLQITVPESPTGAWIAIKNLRLRGGANLLDFEGWKKISPGINTFEFRSCPFTTGKKPVRLSILAWSGPEGEETLVASFEIS